MEGLVSGVAGGGVVGLIAAILFLVGIFTFKRVLAERDKLLEKQTSDMQDRIGQTATQLTAHISRDNPAALIQQVKELDRKIEKHLNEDNPAVVANEFKHINGTLEKISNQVGLMVTDVARLQATVGENEKFTRSLHGSIRELREEIKNLSRE